MTDHWTVQSNLYYRRFHQEHVDGNAAEVERCSGNAANPLFNTLCLENDGFPAQPQANFQILNPNNQPVIARPGAGNTCATRAVGHGRSHLHQRDDDRRLAAGPQRRQGVRSRQLFPIGASVDRSKIGFQGTSELGYIYPDFFVGPNAAVPGTGQIIHTAGDIGFAPVSLAAWNTYYGAYFNETFDITNRLSVTAGGRYNLAQIALSDLNGNSPDLNAQYTFARFNPVAGFTYKILPELMTFYAGYSEANRAPTPLELGCSNPLQALPAGRVSGLRSAAEPGCRAHARGRAARQHQHRRRPRRLEARPVPHRQRERHHPGRECAAGPRRVPERPRHPPAGA